MKTQKILIVEDTPAEMEKAREAAKKLGLEVVCYDPSFDKKTNRGWSHDWDKLMAGVDGVCTDLYWGHPRSTGMHDVECDSQPCGLLVVIHAVSKGIPVVVCTDVGDPNVCEGGHHGAKAGFIYDGYGYQQTLTRPNSKSPAYDPRDEEGDSFFGERKFCSPAVFGWQEMKDWEWALRCLSKTILAKQASA